MGNSEPSPPFFLLRLRWGGGGIPPRRDSPPPPPPPASLPRAASLTLAVCRSAPVGLAFSNVSRQSCHSPVHGFEPAGGGRTGGLLGAAGNVLSAPLPVCLVGMLSIHPFPHRLSVCPPPPRTGSKENTE